MPTERLTRAEGRANAARFLRHAANQRPDQQDVIGNA
jgi:hypothetical protein